YFLPERRPLLLYVVTFAPTVASLEKLVPLVERSILKPLSPEELSVQLKSIRLAKVEAAARLVGAASAATTVICNVALSEPPLPSEPPTVNEFVPIFALAGVPLREPLAATESQAGPLVFANVSGSLSGSLALPAMEPL